MPRWRNLPAGRQVGRQYYNNMAYYVYVISSNTKSYIYVGITNNIQRRMEEHNCGQNKTTRPYAPFNTVLTEKYNDRPTARLREKFLKSGCGKEWIKRNIK
ncbi:MAG: GIY-YIG nuclease family protein [Parcubacteria group bacterium]